MKTAVEWLVEQYKKVGGISISMAEQAKEMEKEQIIKAYWASYKEGQYSGDKTADEYYNETFKQQAKEMEKNQSYTYDEIKTIAYNAYCLAQLDEPTEGKYNLWIQQYKKNSQTN